MTLTDRVLNRVIELARRTPYFHLLHGDGSLYMERYWIVPFADTHTAGCYVATWRKPVAWLLQRLGIALRLHRICTPDLDRALHDHPWDFISVVLRGWYAEARPILPERADFYEVGHPLTLQEPTQTAYRGPGSVALRRFWHRHRIAEVSVGGVWTLFITFRKRQSWGFYTPQGKIWHWGFESVHNNNNNKPVP